MDQVILCANQVCIHKSAIAIIKRAENGRVINIGKRAININIMKYSGYWPPEYSAVIFTFNISIVCSSDFPWDDVHYVQILKTHIKRLEASIKSGLKNKHRLNLDI